MKQFEKIEKNLVKMKRWTDIGQHENIVQDIDKLVDNVIDIYQTMERYENKQRCGLMWCV